MSNDVSVELLPMSYLSQRERERKREKDRARERESESVCVCVCVRERERSRGGEGVCRNVEGGEGRVVADQRRHERCPLVSHLVLVFDWGGWYSEFGVQRSEFWVSGLEIRDQGLGFGFWWLGVRCGVVLVAMNVAPWSPISFCSRGCVSHTGSPISFWCSRFGFLIGLWGSGIGVWGLGLGCPVWGFG